MPLQPHGLEEPQTACGRLRFWQTATPITAPDLKLFGTQTCRWLQPSSPSAHRYTLSRLNAPTSNAPAQTLLHAWFFGEPCCYTLAPFSAALVLRLQTRHLNYRGIVIASISKSHPRGRLRQHHQQLTLCAGGPRKVAAGSAR